MSSFVLLALALAPTASAHKPTFGGGFTGPDSAFQVDDPNISIVVYQDIQCDEDQLWFAFEAEEGFPLYVQLGVPEIDRLADYRPSVALLAPGLPGVEEQLPFDVPEGLGVQVFHSKDVDVPDEFYEPFTQTSSWVVVEERITLPESGPAYMVAWDPEQWTGKLWLATGEVEDFSDVDSTDFIYWGEAVNDFHETGVYGRVEPREEMFCGADQATDAAEDNRPVEQTGCTSAPVMGGLGLALMAAAGRRRRD